MTGAPTPGDRPAITGWPINLLVRDRAVLVVGAGNIAARKIDSLLQLGALVTVVAPVAGPEVAAWARDQRLVLVERPYEPTDLDEVWLVVTATDVPAVNAQVYADATARRLWCNSADDPANCAFTLLSVVRRGDLVIAFGTGGRSPALATHLRKRFTKEFGPEYATLVDLLAEAREAIRATGRSSEDADWQRAFESGIVELVRDGRVDEAKELLLTCL